MHHSRPSTDVRVDQVGKRLGCAEGNQVVDAGEVDQLTVRDPPCYRGDAVGDHRVLEFTDDERGGDR